MVRALSGDTSPASADVLLLHADDDRSFVERLARDFAAAGATTHLGDGYIEGDELSVDRMAALPIESMSVAVVVSPHSAHKAWVSSMLSLANPPVPRERVIALVASDGKLPMVVAEHFVVDFSRPRGYRSSLEHLLARCGYGGGRPADRLLQLASLDDDLAAVVDALRRRNLTDAVLRDLSDVELPDATLSEFLSHAIREARVQYDQLLGLAIWTLTYIDRREVGYEAIDYCLTSPELARSLGERMQYATADSAIRWFHSRLVRDVRDDVAYDSFLSQHAAVVVDTLHDEMVRYLLVPERGPARYNLATLERVIPRARMSWLFQARWCQWISDGYFDGLEMEGSEQTRLLYTSLNRHWDDDSFEAIINAAHEHVRALLSSTEREKLTSGLTHLVAMVYTKYRGAEYVENEVLDNLGGIPEADLQSILVLVRRGLNVVAEYHEGGPARLSQHLDVLDEMFSAVRGIVDI